MTTEIEQGTARLKKHLPWESWGVKIASLLTVLTGIINLTSAVQPALHSRLLIIETFIPLEVRHGSRMTSALAGFALLLLAGGLWRRKGVAWALSVLLLVVSIITHLIKGLDFEEAGLAAWNIEYRRVGNPGGGFPGTFFDVGCAVDYVREIALSHPVDSERVLVMGHSAGGHLALWAAGRHRIPVSSSLYMAKPLIPCAAFAIAGIPDLLLGWEQQVGDDVVVAKLVVQPHVRGTQDGRSRAGNGGLLGRPEFLRHLPSGAEFGADRFVRPVLCVDKALEVVVCAHTVKTSARIP